MGCDVEAPRQATSTVSSPVRTATLPVANTPVPSASPTPPELPTAPEAAPVDGVTSTQVNVRAEPSTGSNVLGVIPAEIRVEITGRDPGGNWWQIHYPQGTDQKGWVTAQYVVASNPDQISVIGGSEATPGEGPLAIVQQQINVRSGPGTGFNSLGTLNPQDVVNLTGKDSNGAWLQIDFPPGPEGRGWLNAAFVQAQGVEDLPIITEAGVVVGTGTPTDIPPAPTATVVPAREDNDSPENPIVSVLFEPMATRGLIYQGDVSAPEGDAEDWVQFIPSGERISLEISCTGSEPAIELLRDREVVGEPACVTRQTVEVIPGQLVQIHISAESGNSLHYSSYSLKVFDLP
jgi:uncharacterized protein YraI